MIRNYGFKKSYIDGTELDASRLRLSLNVPDKYILKSIPNIRNQGNRPICVSEVCTDMLIWKSAIHHSQYNYPESKIYDSSPHVSSDGMSPKDAFEYIKKELILPFKINGYAKIGSYEIARRCILGYGPILIALPVYSYNNEFWKNNYGSEYLGGHALGLVGWNEKGFILRNSWGLSYGNKGYINFSYKDFEQYVIECWCLI